MKNIFISTILLISASTSFSMPCDTGYKCTSLSGKYKIELQRCRYVNRLGNLSSVKIDNKEIAGAELGAAFDGKSIGDSLLAFEISIPNKTVSLFFVKRFVKLFTNSALSFD